MSVKFIRPVSRLRGEFQAPGDKSISHRSVMFGSIARGTTEIKHFLNSADCQATIQCFQKMGIVIEQNADRVLVHSRGLHGLRAPSSILNVGNSGTTARLISGILSGQPFPATISGDDSLRSRPMARILMPLTRMGANVRSVLANDCAPLSIAPGNLHGIHYVSPVASAQVKSSLLLAGLYADGETSITEPALSRNHTELMLQGFGATVTSAIHENGNATATIQPCEELYGQQITIPGDISSAAYFVAAALLTNDSELLIKNVGTNATRAGFLKVCDAMGANITLLNEFMQGGEPRADLLVKTSPLRGTTIEGALIPTLIDELPILAVMAACAEGTTIIRDAAELKVKESNRIDTITANLRAMGADVLPTDDGLIIHGTGKLCGAKIESHFDHRIAMAFTIAGLVAHGETEILQAECVDVSFPEFYNLLESIIEK